MLFYRLCGIPTEAIEVEKGLLAEVDGTVSSQGRHPKGDAPLVRRDSVGKARGKDTRETIPHAIKQHESDAIVDVGGNIPALAAPALIATVEERCSVVCVASDIVYRVADSIACTAHISRISTCLYQWKYSILTVKAHL